MFKVRIHPNVKEALGLFFLLLLIFLPTIVTVCRLSYLAYNNSSDSFLYFDIARHLANGQGFLLTFNPYQYWPGISYPALPFVHIGYPLFLSGLYLLFPAIQSLIYSNFIFAFVNCYLIFLIVKKIYKSPILGGWSACLVAAMVSMEITLLRLLTEQMSLFFLLVAVVLFISKKEQSLGRGLALGFLLGLGFLVRSPSIIYPFIFALALLCSRDDTVRRGFKLFFVLVVPLLIIGLYGGFIFWRFGVFFPEYPRAFQNYYVATLLATAKFFNQLPVIRPLVEGQASSFYGAHLFDAARVLFCNLRILLVFCLIGFWQIFKTRRKEEWLLFWLGLFPIAATVLVYPYMRVSEFEWARFLLVPIVFLTILAVKQWHEAAEKFFPRTKKFIFHAVLAIVFVSNLYQSGEVLQVYWKRDAAEERVASLRDASEWVRNNTGESDLVAVSMFVLVHVYLERPTVILPQYKAFNFNNLRDFVSIYKPRVIIIEKTVSPKFASDLARLGYHSAAGSPLGGVFLVFKPSEK